MYESYAAVYDAIGQGRLGAQLAGWALAWLAARAEPPRRVLDLACGTGEAALVFARAGCAVVGVDRSHAVLEIARGKARDAGLAIEFAECDIRELEPRRPQEAPDPARAAWLALRASRFDLAVSFYDSLNYLTADGDLDRVFGGVAAALRPGGWWIFDLNTEAVFLAHDECDLVTYDSPALLVYNRLSYDRGARLGTGRIVWFVREIDRWWRGEETHTERVWPGDDVAAALERNGLTLVAQLEPGGAPAGAAAHRVIFLAHKR